MKGFEKSVIEFYSTGKIGKCSYCGKDSLKFSRVESGFRITIGVVCNSCGKSGLFSGIIKKSE